MPTPRNPHRAPDLTSDRRRVGAVAVGVVVVLVILAGRVGVVAIVQRAHWQAAAAAQSQSRVVLNADRGSITDRNGVDLATDVEQDDVVVDPQQVDDVDYYAHALAPVLGIDEATLRYRMRRERLKNGQWLQYRVIAPNIDDNAVEILKEMSFPGISVVTEPSRFDPAGELAASLLGRTVPGNDGPVGVSGLEQQYDKVLRGTAGMETAQVASPYGDVPIPGSQHQRQAHPGSDLELTLDEGIQYQAEQSVLAQVAAQNARAGMAVVLDLKTGDVLAMVSVRGGAHPHVADATDAELPLTYSYSPGSVMKIVTVSKAFDSGMLPTDRFTVPDRIMNGTFPLQDDEVHPTESWTPWDILTQSSNVGTAEIAQHWLSPTTLDSAMRSFGFGRRTGIDFAGEATGVLLPPSQYGDSGLMSNAIGYSSLVTPMQMLDAYATIARGGMSIRPRLVRAIVSPNGVHHNEPIHVGARVVSSTTATTMQQIFENVVRAGTGYCAAVPGYDVAGKTGTVKKLGSQGAADPGGHFATFAGFAPATAPRLAAIVVLDDPSSVYGGSAAAPVWSQIMGNALLRMQVPAGAATPGLPPQYDQAHYGHATSCSIPSFTDTMANRAREAYAAAHPTTTTSSTSTTSTTTAAKHANPKQGPGSTTTTPAADKPKSTTVTRPTTAVTTTTAAANRID